MASEVQCAVPLVLDPPKVLLSLLPDTFDTKTAIAIGKELQNVSAHSALHDEVAANDKEPTYCDLTEGGLSTGVSPKRIGPEATEGESMIHNHERGKDQPDHAERIPMTPQRIADRCTAGRVPAHSDAAARKPRRRHTCPSLLRITPLTRLGVATRDTPR